MIDADICRLNDQEAEKRLDRLEADIWADVEARLQAKRMSRAVLSCQALALAVVLVGGIAVSDRATDDSTGAAFDVFSIRSDLAPSTRLLGH